MVKAIFFDIDGTLVSLRTHTAPASTLRALEELRARGVKLFIASGRPPYQIEFLSRQLPFRFDGFVLLNGQYCIDGEGQVLHRHALPQASFRELLPYLEREQIAVSFMELDGCYFNRINDRVERLWADLGGTVPHEPVADPARALTEATYQLNAFVPP
ncbi:MAG: HAD-IIB family hydrolase, partial [Gemmiger sp.]